MSWAGCQNNPIDANFHLQKSLGIFEKYQLTKSDLTRTKMSYPVPDRVKLNSFSNNCVLSFKSNEHFFRKLIKNVETRKTQLFLNEFSHFEAKSTEP